MTANGVGYLTKIDNGLDSDLYVKILEEELEETIDWYGLDRRSIIFQHDNDPKHTAITTLASIFFMLASHGLSIRYGMLRLRRSRGYEL